MSSPNSVFSAKQRIVYSALVAYFSLVKEVIFAFRAHIIKSPIILNFDWVLLFTVEALEGFLIFHFVFHVVLSLTHWEKYSTIFAK